MHGLLTAKYLLLDPHPSEIKSWEDNNFMPDEPQINLSQSMMLERIGTGKTKVLKGFYRATGVPYSFCIESEEDPIRPIERLVTKIYRTGDGKMYFVQTLKGQNWEGSNAVELTQIVGKHRQPVYNGLRDRQTGIMKVNGVRTFKEVYDLPFTTEAFLDPSKRERTTLADLPKSPKLGFYVISNDKKYQCVDVSFEDFTTRPVSDLVYYATHSQQWPIPPATDATIKAQTEKAVDKAVKKASA